MKKITFLLLTMVILINCKAQVGIGTSSPEASAALDVHADSLGFLPPRMDSAQRNAIASPAAGLTITPAASLLNILIAPGGYLLYTMSENLMGKGSFFIFSTADSMVLFRQEPI